MDLKYVQLAGEHCTAGPIVTYTLHQTLFGYQLKVVEMGGECSAHGSDKTCLQTRWEVTTSKHRSKQTILKWILKNEGVNM